MIDEALVAGGIGPGQAVGSVASLDQGGLPVGGGAVEGDGGDLVAGVAGDVGYFAVGADQDFLRLGGDVDGVGYGEGFEVDDGYLGGLG